MATPCVAIRGPCVGAATRREPNTGPVDGAARRVPSSGREVRAVPIGTQQACSPRQGRAGKQRGGSVAAACVAAAGSGAPKVATGANSKSRCNSCPAPVARNAGVPSGLRHRAGPTQQIPKSQASVSSTSGGAGCPQQQGPGRNPGIVSPGPVQREANGHGGALSDKDQVDEATCEGEWEVHTVKRGWAPLTPALQPALHAAMASPEEKVDILVDVASKAWVPQPALVDASIRERCVAYVAMPQQRALGKVGGEPPRPVRWQPRVAAGTVLEASGALASSEAAAAEFAEAAEAGKAGEAVLLPEVAPEAAVVSDLSPKLLTAFAEQPQTHCMESIAESADANDVLMFTAQPADGILIQSSVFERLRQGASERCAAHRYSALAHES